MPALAYPITFPVFSPSTGSIPLQPRGAIEPRKPSGGYTKPGNLSAGVLVVFCLIGASLALLVWWLFVKRSGFIWRKSDWDDYKSSVLRRPEERPDDAITVFSDGTTRRGGGSSVGARTVVLGELDTSITKSMVINEKPWGPRAMPGAKRNYAKSFLGSVWGKGEGTIWGRLRGGNRSDADTEVAREKEMRHHGDAMSITTEETFVDTQRPAPPLTNLTHSNLTRTDMTEAPVIREPSKASYARGDDRGTRYARPGERPSRHRSSHRGHPKPKPKPEPIRHQSVSSESESETDSDDSSDEESVLDQSQLGMGKGTKSYPHPLSRDNLMTNQSRALVRTIPGTVAPYGGSSSNVGRGYRAGSVGSLSSEGSVASSHAGR